MQQEKKEGERIKVNAIKIGGRQPQYEMKSIKRISMS